MIIDPPVGFDTSFFDWLVEMGENLLVVFIERGGLSDAEINALAQEVGGYLPTQIRAYYENCSPWAVWRDSQSVWQRIRENVSHTTGIIEPMLPIDINSQQRNHTIARILSREEYEIVVVKQDKAVKFHKGDLRSYLIGLVEEEVRLSSA